MPAAPHRPYPRLTSMLLASMLIGTVAHGLFPASPLLPATLLAWTAVALQWRSLPRRLQRQAGLLLGIGLVAATLAYARGAPPPGLAALAANQTLIALLLAVTFLRLVTSPTSATVQTRTRGRRALWQTLLGVHLFGSVINLSAMFIIGDRLVRNGRLGRRRAVVLVRGLAAAAFWSPFFAAMAAALHYAPGAALAPVMVAGLPLAAVALLLTARELGPAGTLRAAPFRGYPVSFEALWIPLVLVALVLGLRALQPSWSVLIVIALCAPLLTLGLLLARGPRHGGQAWVAHAGTRLADSAPELTLFLAAGVLAAGLGELVGTLAWWPHLVAVTGPVAVFVLWGILALAALGVHPVISLSLIATGATDVASGHALLACAYVIGWGLGVLVNPLSGVSLSMQARYGIDGMAFQRWNRGYVLRMLVIASALLLGLGQLPQWS